MDEVCDRVNDGDVVVDRSCGDGDGALLRRAVLRLGVFRRWEGEGRTAGADSAAEGEKGRGLSLRMILGFLGAEVEAVPWSISAAAALRLIPLFTGKSAFFAVEPDATLGVEAGAGAA